VLAAALARERARFRAQPNSAVGFLSTGEAPRQSAQPPAEEAAWGQVAATILNLSEFITCN
jgi:hypothetical protein